MSFWSIQQQVDELFDRAEHPNISHKDDGDFTTLMNKDKFPIAPALSIQIIKDVLEAIMYVSSHLLIYKPCQIFKEHVIYKSDKWGLCNIICYRDPKENPNFSPDRYYPRDYYEHEDQDSQLVWSLGRMWFQMLTDSRIPPIKNLNDKQIEGIIENSGINDVRIIGILKAILIIDKKKRKDLTQIIENGLFEYEQKSKIYSKIMKNQFESKIGKSNLKEKGQLTPFNPFQQQLFKRDFRQAIVIADFLQKIKKIIQQRFENNQDNHQTAFSCYLIDLISYVRLSNLKVKGEKLNYMLVLIYDKAEYTIFLEKLLELEGRIQKKRKLNKFQTFRKRHPALFNSPENLKRQDYENQLYRNFTLYLSYYAKCLKKQKKLEPSSKDYKNYVTLINLMLVRSCNYVFSNCRKFMFKDFISDDIFNIRNVLQNIERCTDVVKLARIEQKIKDIYFQNREKNNDD